MSTNPYAPPKSEVGTPEKDRSESVPEEITKKIKHACTAGLISAAMTFVVTLLAVFGVKMFGFDAWEFADVLLILGLTYGIYRKSRVCAVLMVAYFALSKIMMIVETGKPNGVILSVIFLYYYCQGVAGTFAYHKHIRQAGTDEQAAT